MRVLNAGPPGFSEGRQRKDLRRGTEIIGVREKMAAELVRALARPEYDTGLRCRDITGEKEAACAKRTGKVLGGRH